MLKVKGTKKAVAKKFIGAILGIVFVIAAFFGVHLTMQMDPQEIMRNCPLLGQTESVCTMTATEHIAKWKQLFTFTVQSNKLIFTAFLLISFIFAAFAFQPQIFRSRAGPSEYSSGFLLRALGRGILRKRE